MSTHSFRSSPSSAQEVRYEYGFIFNQAFGLDRVMPPTPPEDKSGEDPLLEKGEGTSCIEWAQKERWKDLQEPFLHLPVEIHLLIFSLLNPIDAVVW